MVGAGLACDVREEVHVAAAGCACGWQDEVSVDVLVNSCLIGGGLSDERDRLRRRAPGSVC